MITDRQRAVIGQGCAVCSLIAGPRPSTTIRVPRGDIKKLVHFLHPTAANKKAIKGTHEHVAATNTGPCAVHSN